MRGGDDTGGARESRRLTPSIGLSAPPEPEIALELPAEESNEDFLFHLYRGSELLQDDRAHEAKEELERALRLQPHDTKGQDLLAVVYFRLGHYGRAISIYEQLRRQNPKDTAILLNLALCYLKTGHPELARRLLDQLVAINPAHTRAWGYLGLACERVGDLDHAQAAFERGGHGQMVKRMAERRAPVTAPMPERLGAIAEPVREVVAPAFEELDAGEISFALAEETDGRDDDAAAQSWRPVELGQRRDTALGLAKNDSIKPDTRDGPPPAPAPLLMALCSGAPFSSPPKTAGAAFSADHRPTLSVPGAPSAWTSRAIALDSDHRPTLIAPGAPPNATDIFASAWFGHQEGSFPLPSRQPVIAVPPVWTSAAIAPPVGPEPTSRRTLPTKSDSGPPPSAAKLNRDSSAPFPEKSIVVVHPSGLALVSTAPSSTFAARLESIRLISTGLATKTLERHAKGKSNGETFGGLGSPIIHAAGEGHLALGPRPGRKLTTFVLEDEPCFVREEVLLGFDGELTYENGKLATGDGDLVSVVQLRGKGAVLLEAVGETMSFDVAPTRGIAVRRDVLLAWFGRLIPRALAASEAPSGQRGLVSFAGEGRVLVDGS